MFRRLSGELTTDTSSRSPQKPENSGSKSAEVLFKGIGKFKKAQSNQDSENSEQSTQTGPHKIDHKAACNVVKFSKAGEILLVGKIDGCLCIWKFERNRLEAKERLHQQGIYFVDLINKERQVITAGLDGFVKISAIFGGIRPLRSIRNGGYITSAFLCHEKKIFFCNGKNENEVNVWELGSVFDECRQIMGQSKQIILEQKKESIRSAEVLSTKEAKQSPEAKAKKKSNVVKVSFKILNENAEKMKKEQNGANYKMLYYEMIKENQYFKEKVKECQREIRELREYNQKLLSRLQASSPDQSL